MLEDYEIEIVMTKSCYKAFRKRHHSPEEAMDKIARIAQTFYETGNHHRVSSLSRDIKLRFGLESTLYLISLGYKENALVAIDEDFIEQVLLVTIWDYSWEVNPAKMYRNLINSLYERYLYQEGESSDGQ